MTQENDAFFPVYASHVIRREVKPVTPDYYDLLGKTLSHTIKQDNQAFYTTFYPGK